MSVFCENEPYKNPNVNGVIKPFRGRPHVHVMADTQDELIEYALSIGLKLRWIQHANTDRVHFDAVGPYLTKVLMDPRVEKLSRKDFVERYSRRSARPSDA